MATDDDDDDDDDDDVKDKAFVVELVDAVVEKLFVGGELDAATVEPAREALTVVDAVVVVVVVDVVVVDDEVDVVDTSDDEESVVVDDDDDDDDEEKFDSLNASSRANVKSTRHRDNDNSNVRNNSEKNGGATKVPESYINSNNTFKHEHTYTHHVNNTNQVLELPAMVVARRHVRRQRRMRARASDAPRWASADRRPDADHDAT